MLSILGEVLALFEPFFSNLSAIFVILEDPRAKKNAKRTHVHFFLKSDTRAILVDPLNQHPVYQYPKSAGTLLTARPFSHLLSQK